MLQCILIAGSMFIATDETLINIDNGIAKSYAWGNRNRDLMVKVAPPPFNENPHYILIKERYLESVGLTNDPAKFLTWCYDSMSDQ